MSRLLIAGVTLLLWSLAPTSQEVPPPPKDVPPILGTAVFRASGEDWTVELAFPKVRWQVEGERRPKREWPTLEVSVEESRMTLPMRYDAATQLAADAQNRIVDLTGRRLDRDEAAERLAENTPVLLSVSGRMPDPYYLQCTKPDTLIIVPGLPTRPAPELLVAPAERKR